MLLRLDSEEIKYSINIIYLIFKNSRYNIQNDNGFNFIFKYLKYSYFIYLDNIHVLHFYKHFEIKYASFLCV